jgi:AcrR family transcriptional regulator
MGWWLNDRSSMVAVVTRTRRWDDDDVLDAAMRLFRAQGFEGTSLRAVEQATGLHPGSVYAAYGSKAGLFEAVLGQYQRTVVEARVSRHLDGDRPREAIGAFFRSTFDGLASPDPGCLVTNSAVESPRLGADARRLVGEGLRAIQDGLIGVLRSEIADPTTLEILSSQLVALYQGLLVLVRFGAAVEVLEATVAATEVLIDAAGGAR